MDQPSTPDPVPCANPKAIPAEVTRLTDRDTPLPASDPPMLVFGNGRSFGEVCLNDGGHILLGRGLDRWKSSPAAVQAGIVLGQAPQTRLASTV